MKDQKNRDEIISYDGHIFVLAGAGTGKSTIIAEKIIWLLKHHKINSIHDIAAITYTNKAAAELKWKIEEKLSVMIAKTSDTEDRTIFRESLKNISDASIRTIHSFCAMLLRKYGYHEGIDPLFSILSKNETEIHFTEAFHSYVREYIENGDSDIFFLWKRIVQQTQISRLEDFQYQFRILSEKTHLLIKINEADLIINSNRNLKNISTEIFREYINKFFYYLQYYDFEEESQKSENSLGTKLKLLKILLENNTDIGKLINRFDIYTKDILPGKLRGSSKFVINNCPYENIQSILKTYLRFLAGFHLDYDPGLYKDISSGEMIDHFTTIKFPNHSAITLENLKCEYVRTLWYQALIHFHKYFSEYKLCKSLLSYNDIIYYTSKIINNENVLTDVRKKFKYIFVDEYQDTDPVQTEIFTVIAGLSSDKMSATKPPNLIRVGDAKQSIYSFRGADLETFYSEKTRFQKESTGLLQSLIVNMRSHPVLIAFVNRLFNKNEIPSSLDISDYESLSAGTEKSKLIDPGVYITQFFNEVSADSKLKAREMRNAEAFWMADCIAHLKLSNPDLTICVLFKAMRENIEPYVRELKKRQISLELVGRRYYGENFIKKYVVLFLQILYNPDDKIALTGFLRSPVASLKDKEINDIVSSGIFCFEKIFKIKNLVPDKSIQQKIEKVLDLFNTCLYLLRNQSLSSLLWYLFENSNFYRVTDMLKNREIIHESLDRIMSLGSITDSMIFSSSHNKLQFFLTEIEKLENVPEVDEPGDSFNINNSVQFMSYHKSKGLEFDIVFMPDLFYKSANRYDQIYMESRPASSEVLFQFNNDLSFRKTGIENTDFIMKERKKSELIRLVYVAMTRAKERLYLPVHSNAPANTILEHLWPAFIDKFHIDPEIRGDEKWTRHEFTEGKEPGHFYLNWRNYSIDQSNESLEPETTDNVLFENIPEKKKRADSTRSVPFYSFVSPTSVMKQSKQDVEKMDYDKFRDQPVKEDLDKIEALENTMGAVLDDPVTRGIVTHSLFELIDLKKPVITKEIENSVFYARALDDAQQQKCLEYFNQVIKTYENSKLFEIIQNAGIAGKEIPYSYYPSGEIENTSHRHIVVGYVDLLLNIGNNQLLVVDYKTNKKPDSMLMEKFHENLLKTYEIPMEMYKKALVEAFPSATIQKALYHTDSGSLILYHD